MNAINILEQQHADEVLRLEIAYSNLYKAYVLGDRNEMINHYIATGYIGIPNFAKLVQSKTKRKCYQIEFYLTYYQRPLITSKMIHYCE